MSSATDAALLMLTIPVCTAVLAYFLLGERMTTIRWFSFSLAILGVLLCSDFNFGNLNFGRGYAFGNLLVFSGAVGSAFYNSYGKKALERYSPMEMLYYTYVTMFFLLTPLFLYKERDVIGRIPHFTLQTWTGLVLLGVFIYFLSMVLFLTALKDLDAIQAGLCNYLVTLFGVPIAVIWLGERLTFMAIIGGVLVLLSTLAVTVCDGLQKPVPQ
jgi:drug/metabolite transporter (DMT)-like permease